MLGKLERVVGICLSCSVGVLLHAQAKVEGAHRALGDIVYLTLKECVEGIVHGHIAA